MPRYLHYAEFNKVTFDFMISPPEIKLQVVRGGTGLVRDLRV